LELIYRRALELDRAAVRTRPDNPVFNAELALALGDQGIFFLESGRRSEAESAVREAVVVHQRVLAGEKLNGSIERYVARSFVNLARVLTAAGQTTEAEQCYRKAVYLLEQSVKASPESVYPRADLARVLPRLADLLKGLNRSKEAEETRRRVIHLYQSLKANFADDPEHRRNLVDSYMDLACFLCEAGRQTEAAEPFRQALALEEDDPSVNNDLAWYLATNPEPCLRDTARAVRLAKKVVTASPETANYRNTLGVAFYRSGNNRAAIAELERSMSMQKGGTGMDWFFLAMAHWRLGDHGQARRWFDRAAQWMDRHQPHDDELRRFRAEAQAMLAQPGPC
jgi:tetratricopeptide (TPR) repeat protein